MSDQWRLELRVEITPEPSEQMIDQLVFAGLDIARDPVGIALITYVDGPVDPFELPRLWVDVERRLANDGLDGRVVSGRAMTEDLHEAEALRPDTPELLAATDVAELLGVSRQRVHQLHTEHPQFPEPYQRLGSGPIWTRPAIEAFDRAWARKPGRPAKAS